LNKRDFILVTILGALVGLLSQPVIVNVLAHPTVGIRAAFFFSFIILAPSALYTAYLLEKTLPLAYQFAKYSAVGTLNSFIDAGIFNVALYFIPSAASGATFTFFKAATFILSLTNSYFWNRSWTFSQTAAPNAEEAARFYAVGIIGWLVNVSTASFVVNVITSPEGLRPEIWANVGVACGILAGILWNFLGFKFLVFRA